MSDADAESHANRAFERRLVSRLTELRLAVDLGEITTPAAFRAALERDRSFSLDDPRVRKACIAAGFGGWLQ